MMKLAKLALAGVLIVAAVAVSGANAASTFTVNVFEINRNLRSLNDPFVASVLSTEPTHTGEFSTIDFRDGTRGTRGFFGNSNPFPGNARTQFLVTVTGTFLSAGGDNTFRLLHDDGVRFSVNGDTLIDFVNPTAPRTSFANAALNSGVNYLDIVFFENRGQAVLELASATGAGVRSRNNFELLASAVPEPSTWLMMMVGFALIGLMRRRRARTSVSFR